MISWSHYFGSTEAKLHGGSQVVRLEGGAEDPNVPIKLVPLMTCLLSARSHFQKASKTPSSSSSQPFKGPLEDFET